MHRIKACTVFAQLGHVTTCTFQCSSDTTVSPVLTVAATWHHIVHLPPSLAAVPAGVGVRGVWPPVEVETLNTNKVPHCCCTSVCLTCHTGNGCVENGEYVDVTVEEMLESVTRNLRNEDHDHY